MAATILNSSRAVEISVFVVRAFVQLREFLCQAQAAAPLDRRYVHRSRVEPHGVALVRHPELSSTVR